MLQSTFVIPFYKKLRNKYFHIALGMVLTMQFSLVSGQGINDHQLWDDLVNSYVDKNGFVDYQGFIDDSVRLGNYLQVLSQNHPSESWSTNEQMAYWINAYNAFTIKLIVDYYPLNGIKEIGSKIQVPFVNTPWDIKFIFIGDSKYDLNNIEHKILRKQFDDPRVHFALVCASMSCPKLRQEAYTASKLDEQLQEQTVQFLLDSSRNEIDPERPRLSKIFSWYKGDFTKEGSLVEWLNQYLDTPIRSKAKVSFQRYDWGLNDQARIR